jgi:hypothetical protein
LAVRPLRKVDRQRPVTFLKKRGGVAIGVAIHRSAALNQGEAA